MERVAFKLQLKNGMVEEYKKRHDEIWPEMSEILTQAGIFNYTIWLSESNLFGYYETKDNKFATEFQNNNPVVLRWNVYMKDLIETVENPDGTFSPVVEPLECMFIHE